MSLPSVNIDWPDVASELGMNPAVSQNISVLCSSAGQNPYSYYGQGGLTVDASGTAKLYFTGIYAAPWNWSDWRLYNQNATKPWPAVNFTQNYLGDTTTDVHLTWSTEELNFFAFVTDASWGCYRFYTSTGDRISETGDFWTDEIQLSIGSYGALGDHPRDTGWIGGTQTPTIYSVPVTGLAKPDDIVYLDTYIGDATRSRKINLGNGKEEGYTTITFHQQQLPYVQSGTLSPNPGGMSPYYVYITSSQSTPCEPDTQINQTPGSYNYSFYVQARGFVGATEKYLTITDCSVILVLDGSSQVVYEGALSDGLPEYPKYISGSDLWRYWNYDDVATINIINAVYDSSGTCT